MLVFSMFEEARTMVYRGPIGYSPLAAFYSNTRRASAGSINSGSGSVGSVSGSMLSTTSGGPSGGHYGHGHAGAPLSQQREHVQARAQAPMPGSSAPILPSPLDPPSPRSSSPLHSPSEQRHYSQYYTQDHVPDHVPDRVPDHVPDHVPDYTRQDHGRRPEAWWPGAELLDMLRAAEMRARLEAYVSYRRATWCSDYSGCEWADATE